MSNGGIILKSQIGAIDLSIMGKALFVNFLNNEFTVFGFDIKIKNNYLK